MKKNVMKKWVKALRSGEYAQGKLSLVRISNNGEHQFCCLGVLCNIMQEETGELKVNRVNDNFIFDSNRHILPDSVKNWSDMKSHDGTTACSKMVSLIGLNDDGKSFTEIADVIEENYKEL